MLGQVGALGRHRLGQPHELLVGRELPVADDGRRRDGEVDRAEQRGVELGLGLGQPDRRRRREPDDVHVAQLAQHGADHVAPQRRQVVALVEHHDADAELGELLDPLARGRGEQVAQLHPRRRLALGDLALEHALDAGQLARARWSASSLSNSRIASSGLIPLAAARSSAQRDCASRPSTISGSSMSHSPW